MSDPLCSTCIISISKSIIIMYLTLNFPRSSLRLQRGTRDCRSHEWWSFKDLFIDETALARIKFLQFNDIVCFSKLIKISVNCSLGYRSGRARAGGRDWYHANRFDLPRGQLPIVRWLFIATSRDQSQNTWGWQVLINEVYFN